MEEEEETDFGKAKKALQMAEAGDGAKKKKKKKKKSTRVAKVDNLVPNSHMYTVIIILWYYNTCRNFTEGTLIFISIEIYIVCCVCAGGGGF